MILPGWGILPGQRGPIDTLWCFSCASRIIPRRRARSPYDGLALLPGYWRGLWGLHAAILALAWSLAWAPSRKGIRALFIRFALLSVVLVAPPFGSIAWLSPHLVAGLLYPGWVFLVIALTIVMLASIAATAYGARQSNLALVAAMVIVSAIANFIYTAPAAPAKWAAIDTKLGPFPASDAGEFERHQTLIAAARDSIEARNKVVVLPEEVAGRWRPAASYWWRDLDAAAERRSAVVFVGADLGEGLRFRDALVLVGRQYGNVTSRQPIPLGLWRPWSNTRAIAGWIQPGVVQVAGETAALSFCYEDLLMWPLLVSMWHRLTVVVSVANDWFGDGLVVRFIKLFTYRSSSSQNFSIESEPGWRSSRRSRQGFVA